MMLQMLGVVGRLVCALTALLTLSQGLLWAKPAAAAPTKTTTKPVTKVSTHKRQPSKPNASKTLGTKGKRGRIPKRGPLPEGSVCSTHGAFGSVVNEYKTGSKPGKRIWTGSYCITKPGSVPAEKRFSAQTPDAIRNAFRLPNGWLWIRNSHTQEELCLNLYTGEPCPTPMTAGVWTRAPSITQPDHKPTELTPPTLPLDETSVAIANTGEDEPEAITIPPQIPYGAMPWHTPWPWEGVQETRALAVTDVPKSPDSYTEEEAKRAMERDDEKSEGPAQPYETILQGNFGDFVTDRHIETDLPPIHPNAQDKIMSLFRHYKNDHQHPIYPRLLFVLANIAEHFQTRIELYSGHRFQKRTTSRHVGGRASDITIPGISLAAIKAFVFTLGNRPMGIGMYPRDGFVHLDARDAPYYCFQEEKNLIRKPGGKPVPVKTTRRRTAPPTPRTGKQRLARQVFHFQVENQTQA